MDNPRTIKPIAIADQADKLDHSKTVAGTIIDSKLAANANAPITGTLSKPRNKLRDLLTQNFLAWVKHSIGHFFSSQHTYVNYPAGQTGIYTMRSVLRDPADTGITIALTGDWATNTQESIDVSTAMARMFPEYTIHLGDTYFVGAADEIGSNYIDNGFPWARGTCGSFSLLGNHEMYSDGGKAYLETLLHSPRLGIKDKATGIFGGQKAPYFCLQTKYWNIIGLDTGYNCSKFPNPITSSSDCHFEQSLINWLKETVNLKDDKRGIIFLSHHQYCSAFEDQFFVPAQQLADIIGPDRKVLWFWGHEHRFAIYGRFQGGTKDKPGVTAYGRCIGHGGMPVEINTTIPGNMKLIPRMKYNKQVGHSNLVLADYRYRESEENPLNPLGKVPIGFNGFATLQLQNDLLTISYFDMVDGVAHNPPALVEQWIATGDGQVAGKSAVNNITNNPAFAPVAGKALTDIYA